MSIPQPIPLSEMLVYFEINRIDRPAQRMRYVHLIQELDAIYLEFAAAKVEKANKAAKT